MRALAVVLALALWPASAGAELRARTRDLGAASPVADYAQWTTATTMTGSTCDVRASDLLTGGGRTVTFARSDSTLCCPESDASCCWAGPNEMCVHAPTYQGWASGGTVAGGIEVFGAGENTILRSEEIDHASWTGGSAVPDQCASPNTATTSDRVSGGRYQQQAAMTAYATYTAAAWISAHEAAPHIGSVAYQCNSGTMIACSCGASAGACTAQILSGVVCSASVSVASSAPVRVWATGTCSVAQTAPYIAVAGGIYGGTGDTACIWGAQLTPTAYPVPYRATAGTAYAGNASTATTLTVPVAAGVTDASGAVYAQWITSATTTNARILGFSGSATPAAILSATGLQSWDGTNLLSLSSSWTAGAPSWIRADWGSTKSLATAAASASGAYDGAWLGSVIYVGSNAGTGEHLNGLVSRVVMCRKAGGCK